MHVKTKHSMPFPTNDMSDKVFRLFSDFIYKKSSVKMPLGKKVMLTARLTKRLRHLGMLSFNDYYDYVTSPKGLEEELDHMIDLVTTHKTEFFREAAQFEFLLNKLLPTLYPLKLVTSLKKKLKIWSAGCSTGEEPYTQAMIFSKYFEEKHAVGFSILATDISIRVLNVARKGIYSEDAVETIPAGMKRKYLMRGKGSQKGFYRIVPELRKHIFFEPLNLNGGETFGIRTPMDIIFCRNVIIYFDRETQKKLFHKFYAQLTPGGHMFIGHSETLHGIDDRFLPVGPSIYQKPE